MWVVQQSSSPRAGRIREEKETEENRRHLGKKRKPQKREEANPIIVAYELRQTQ